MKPINVAKELTFLPTLSHFLNIISWAIYTSISSLLSHIPPKQNPPLIYIHPKLSNRCIKVLTFAFVFARHIKIDQVVQPNAAVIRGDQYLVLAGHRFNAADLAASSVLAASRANVNLRMVPELLGCVEQTTSIVRSNYREFAILAKISGRYQLGRAIYLVPHSHLFVRNVPQP